MEIPKVIHYCWFGQKPLPSLAKKCMTSWKKFCPDYQIMEWNEKNFDVNSILYTSQAYQAKKYAFVSDYARFYALEQLGGIYLDTDVELIRSLEGIVKRGGYIGCEQDGEDGIVLNPGLGMAAKAHNPLLQELLQDYQSRKFINPDNSLNLDPIGKYTTEIFKKHGLKDISGLQKVEDFIVYPREYFSPQHYRTGKLTITSKTYSIHHYSASWYSPYGKFANKMSHILGETWTRRIVKCKKAIKCRIGR